MKRMAAILGLLFVCLCLSAQVRNAGCYLRLVEPQTNEQELTWENDTIKVSFEFNSLNIFVGINIWNKTQKTISVNWDKTLLIQDNTSSPIIFDDTVMLLKDQPKGSSSIAPGTKIYRNISTADNVEYDAALYSKRDVKKLGNQVLGFVVPIESGGTAAEYRFSVEISLQ